MQLICDHVYFVFYGLEADTTHLTVYSFCGYKDCVEMYSELACCDCSFWDFFHCQVVFINMLGKANELDTNACLFLSRFGVQQLYCILYTSHASLPR